MLQIDFRPGDTVRVHQKIKDGDKTRTQIFEGVVIGIKGRDENKSVTVRKHSFDGVFVERILQLASPFVEKIVVKEQPRKPVKRAKLYHLRNKRSKKS